jgi:hypothetical protein
MTDRRDRDKALVAHRAAELVDGGLQVGLGQRYDRRPSPARARVAESRRDLRRHVACDRVRPAIPLELLTFGLTSTLSVLARATVPPGPASPDGGVIADWHGSVGDPAALAAHLDASLGVVAMASSPRSRGPRSSSSGTDAWSIDGRQVPHPSGDERPRRRQGGERRLARSRLERDELIVTSCCGCRTGAHPWGVPMQSTR